MSELPYRDQLKTFEVLLNPARARLTSAARQNAAKREGALLAKCFAVIAAAALVGNLFGRTFAALPSSGILSGVLAALFGAVMLFAAGRGFRSVKRHDVTSRTTAERLDLCHDEHNRVATALDFVERGEQSGFALAAIDDGVALLRVVAPRPLAAPEVTGGSDRRVVATLAVACGVVLLVAIIRVGLTSPVGLQHSIAERPSLREASQAAPPSAGQKEPRDTVPQDPDVSPTQVHARLQDRPLAISESKPRSSAQLASKRSSGSTSASSANGGGQNAPSTTASSASSPGAAKPDEAIRSRPQPSVQLNPDQAAASGTASKKPSQASLAGSGLGAGRFKAVAGHGTQRENPPDAGAEAMDEQGDIEESTSANDQRGGIQPSLPDRTAAPSRELGITGPKSKRPGTGRGGPSPLKKSRGTASLLMGVPIPDFVRGKLGPGPVAVTVENMAPQAYSSADLDPVGASVRTLPESIIRRTCVPWEDAYAVQAYLGRWHSRDRTDVDGPVSLPSAESVSHDGTTRDDENDS